MKFETILEAFEGMIEGMERTDYLGDDWLYGKHTRQRAAFRARLERMYHGLERDFFNVLITSAGDYEEAEVNGEI